MLLTIHHRSRSWHQLQAHACGSQQCLESLFGPGRRRCQCPCNCGYGYVIIHTCIHMDMASKLFIYLYVHTCPGVRGSGGHRHENHRWAEQLQRPNRVWHQMQRCICHMYRSATCTAPPHAGSERCDAGSAACSSACEGAPGNTTAKPGLHSEQPRVHGRPRSKVKAQLQWYSGCMIRSYAVWQAYVSATYAEV